MTDVRVEPISGTLDADVTLPGSKSLTNRALAAAALANGVSELRNCGVSDDIDAMIDAVEAFGIRVDREGATLRVHGTGRLRRPDRAIDARMSGTTARFVAPMLLVSGGGRLDAHEQMRGRPMGPQFDAMRSLGAAIDADTLPVEVAVDASLGDTVAVDASVSSQFVSGLLLAAPALPDGLTIDLVGDPVSTPYLDMTVAVMRAFGAHVDARAGRYVVAGDGYHAATYEVEPDASTATYPLAAAAIVGGRVRVLGLGSSSVQGDARFTDVIEAMGAEVHRDERWTEVRGSGVLTGVNVDLGDMSDTAPTFAALAAHAAGHSSATGIGFIRATKESDRVGAAVAELQRLGLEATVDEDGFSVRGGDLVAATVETYEDHRMAMALSLVGLRGPGVTVSDAECVAKTFPGFFEMLDDLRASVRSQPLVVAIDGPAGSGKSTVAALVARELRLPHLDTGAMYRAVTLAVLRAGTGLDDHDAIAAAAQSAVIDVGPRRVLLDGEDVSLDIRSPAVTAAVSPVAAVGGVRAVLAELQRGWAQARGAAVVEGRDIGSAVFPHASVKVYLTASVDERARRRAAEMGETDLVAMAERIRARDEIDSNREVDPLTIAEGATVIDSTELAVSEVVSRIVRLVQEELAT